MMFASVLKSLVVLGSLSPVNVNAEPAGPALRPLSAIDRDLPRQVTDAIAAAGERLAGSIRPEVRLRKLHLVRPDLIPYPIMYEVYC